MNKKKLILCIIGAVVLAAALILTFVVRPAALEADRELKAANTAKKECSANLEELKKAEAPQEDLDKAQAALTAAEQDAADKKAALIPVGLPFALGLIGVIVGIVMVITALIPARPAGETAFGNVRSLAMTALFAALCFVGFEYFRIDIPLGAGSTAFHLGNVFCVLAALLLGGLRGGMAGAIGLTIADLSLPQYMIGAPKTFLLKLGIGLVTGLVAHRVFAISRNKERKVPLPVAVILSSAAGMAFNIIADPLVGYFYKLVILGAPEQAAKVWMKFNIVTTSVNAVIAVIAASVLYLALRPALKHARLIPEIN